MLQGFDPTLLLVLNLAGTFAFGVSGALAGVRARLDLFGVAVLAAVVGLAGGVIRDVLIGVRPTALRDWHYLAAVAVAAVLVIVAHRHLERTRRAIEVMDAAGLSLFCVTGAVAALDHGFGAPDTVILGVLSAIGGGVLRDLLLGRVPVVLRRGRGLYAVPALVGATVVVVAYEFGWRGIGCPIGAAGTCFALRMLGLHLGFELPRADSIHGFRQKGDR